MRRLLVPIVLLAVGLIASCDNNPYPEQEADLKVIYSSYLNPPRTLDPAVSYTVSEHVYTANLFDTLLEYHLLARPYEMIPALALEVPQSRAMEGGRFAYDFRMREDIFFHNDPVFQAFGNETDTRQVTADDIIYQLMRIADPDVGSPVVTTFQKIYGFQEFTDRLVALRAADPAFGELAAREQYAIAGPVSGLVQTDELAFTLILSESYPQILYWFAMPFTTPVAWEAVEYYDGDEGRDHFRDHPVGTGPFRITHYEKQHRIVLDRNELWYGALHPEWRAPATIYPDRGEEGDEELGLLQAEYVGQPLPFVDRIEFRRERESIPRFGKFLQGYYDASGIINESFDQVIQEDALSPEMEALGMRLLTTVDTDIFYLGFNMDDPVIGRSAGERGRLLRQAMSLVIDSEEYTRLFLNGRGIPAQSPLPPDLFGYDEDYRNPYRQVSVERARELMVDAGYEAGIDSETGLPLNISFDGNDTTSRGILQMQFFANAWAQLGINIEINATNYNQFQDRMRNGAYQIFRWGWVADYPDPENFLFILETGMGRSQFGGPNTANFTNARFDELFYRMKGMENSDERLEIINEMIAILEEERPWIELIHRETYSLVQPWIENVKPFGMSYPTLKYRDVDVEQRTELRAAWNEPVLWPVYALIAIGFAVVIPGITTWMRERQ